MTNAERNHYDNLIYVCANCHLVIDKIPEGEKEYPTERLKRIKSEHEAKVHQAIKDGFADVGFAELAVATEWVFGIPPTPAADDYCLLKLEPKIRMNGLGDDERTVITIGLSNSGAVARFVETVTQTDPEFPRRLRAGILEQYWHLKRQGLSGGDLFEAMCRFVQRGLPNQVQRCAALAVLIYLFEMCEVFER